MTELRQLIREAIIETLLAEKMPRGSAMRQPSTSAGRAARLGTTSVYHTQLGLPAKRGPGEEPEDADDSHFEPEPPEQVAKHVSRPIRPTVGKPNYKAYIAARGRGPIPTYTQADIDTYDKQYPPEKPSKPVDEIDAYVPRWGKQPTPEEKRALQIQREKKLAALKQDKTAPPTDNVSEISPELARKYAYSPGGGAHRYQAAMKVAKHLGAKHGLGSREWTAADAEAQRQGKLYHHAKDIIHKGNEQAQTGNVGEKIDYMKEISPELARRYLYLPGGGASRYIAAMKTARRAHKYPPEAQKAAQSDAERAARHYHHAKDTMNKHLDRPDSSTDTPQEGCH